jgi:hypothetical protein
MEYRLGSSSTYLIARFNRRGQTIDARRKAYASWFTALELVHNRIVKICATPVGIPKDTEKQSAFTAEIDASTEDNRALLTALNVV